MFCGPHWTPYGISIGKMCRRKAVAIILQGVLLTIRLCRTHYAARRFATRSSIMPFREKSMESPSNSSVAATEQSSPIGGVEAVNPKNSFGDFTIYLALSGGGIRATLFHLGVLRFLKQCGYLPKISHVTSVSGGSITAGHLLQNWDRYAKGDDTQFIEAASDLIKGAAHYGIREHIAYNFTAPGRRFDQLHRCYLTGLARDKREAELRSILDTPSFHILGTDFSTGNVVEFSREGIALLNVDQDGALHAERPARNSTDASFGLWRAVACSSAFPPMFPPHLISPQEYASKTSKNITVGDGGVYDNLGIGLIDYLSRQEQDPDRNVLFLVSDAGLPFQNGLVSSSSYRWAIDRMTRASDIQFYRVADADVRRFSRQCEDDPHRRIATIRIGDIVPSKEDECVLDEAVQKLVGNVRTDLDTFSGEEVHAVIQHGWELARQVVSDQTGLTVDSKRSIEWLPAKRDVTQDQMVDRLRTSGARKFYWRPLFSFRDTAVAALVSIPVCFLLLYAMFNLLGWHILNHARYKQLVDIEAGQVGVLSRWWYNLDKEVALVEVQSSKMPEVVGRSYVIVVMRMPTDGTSLREETKTVVSKVQKFQGIGGTVVEDHVPCARFANSVFYGDAMLFYLYVIPDEKILAMQHAIDMQTDQPLTVDRITKEFGGIRLGGGMDDAKFDVDGELIKSAKEALGRKRAGK
jgi:predicted acylesterase/phospholipase RssA